MHFLLLFGPPAVGKMTIGRTIERATGIRLFHNHMTIEMVLPFFPFGDPAFGRLVDGFRRQLLHEVAHSDLPGVSFTLVWDLESASDTRFLEQVCKPFRERGARITFVELRASLEERLVRNRCPDRLAEKPSKRDVVRSEASLLKTEQFRMNTLGPIPLDVPHLIVETDGRSIEDVATEIIDTLGLERLETGPGDAST